MLQRQSPVLRQIAADRRTRFCDSEGRHGQLAETGSLSPDLFDLSSIGAILERFGAEIGHPQFWVNLVEIIWINVLLSGDNALVVAMACRGLEPRQRLWGMVLGTAAAVLLRVAFTVFVTSVMGLPYLKLVGGLALLV